MELVREIMYFIVRGIKLPLYKEELLSISFVIGDWRIMERLRRD
jgi:hypothetical protein